MTPQEFKEARANLGYTQVELAAKLGKCERIVKYYEAGHTPVPQTVALLLQSGVVKPKKKGGKK